MRRLTFPGLAAIVLLAAATAACGGDGDASPASGSSAATRCFEETEDFLDALRGLALKIVYIEGVYVGYREEVEKLRDARGATRFPTLPAECSRGVARPANRAFAAYVAAFERWQQCATRPGGCDTASIRAELAGHWQRADELRMEAEQNLDELLQAEEAKRGYGPAG